jgi:hypothetical protein
MSAASGRETSCSSSIDVKWHQLELVAARKAAMVLRSPDRVTARRWLNRINDTNEFKWLARRDRSLAVTTSQRFNQRRAVSLPGAG